jgi:hypothetical protein
MAAPVPQRLHRGLVLAEAGVAACQTLFAKGTIGIGRILMAWIAFGLLYYLLSTLAQRLDRPAVALLLMLLWARLRDARKAVKGPPQPSARLSTHAVKSGTAGPLYLAR